MFFLLLVPWQKYLGAGRKAQLWSTQASVTSCKSLSSLDLSVLICNVSIMAPSWPVWWGPLRIMLADM